MKSLRNPGNQEFNNIPFSWILGFLRVLFLHLAKMLPILFGKSDFLMLGHVAGISAFIENSSPCLRVSVVTHPIFKYPKRIIPEGLCLRFRKAFRTGWVKYASIQRGFRRHFAFSDGILYHGPCKMLFLQPMTTTILLESGGSSRGGVSLYNL